MIVGVLRIELHIPCAHSLKEKRSPLKSLLAQLENRFHCAAAEVEHQDLHQRAVVGLSVVGADGRFVGQRLQSVREFLHTQPDMSVIRIDEQTLSVG